MPVTQIIVFFVTARITQFHCELFNAMGEADVGQIHSRMTQAKRTRTADNFRNSTRVRSIATLCTRRKLHCSFPCMPPFEIG